MVEKRINFKIFSTKKRREKDEIKKINRALTLR